MFVLTVVPLPITGDYNDPSANPSQRLATIRSLIRVAESRVKDLEALLSSLILQKPLGTVISDVDNEDENLVRQELYSARSYEGFLRNEENFWNQVRDANKQAEKQTQDFFKPA